MANATYIYKAFKNIKTESDSLKSQLDHISKWVYENYNTKLYFCEISGKRWSFYAGFKDFIVSQERIQLTDNFGIFVETINTNQEIWAEILRNIKISIE